MAVVQLLSFFIYRVLLFPPCCSCESATGLLSCLTINDAYRCICMGFPSPSVFFAATAARPQQPHRDNDYIQQQPDACSIADKLSFFLSLSLSLMHTIVCWPMAPPYISVDLSSSSRKKEPPLQQKISLCWFIYQDLRLHFDDHHHLFRFYFLCNFASYRHREFRNKRRGGKTNKQKVALKKKW